jgi:ABC-type nickel/cobalt efflux system permease component RcnA
MATIDGWLEGYLHGPAGLGLIILVSLALGLRHASDPDHLAAVTTLIASEENRKPARKAGLMGLLWGLGHGTTLLVLGLPLVLAGRHLPNLVQQAAESLIGALIVLLAARLLLRWRRGLFHTHPHTYGSGGIHAHVHSHREEVAHSHTHSVPPRAPIAAYGVGLVHGIGGSGGLTLLLLSTIPDPAQATEALMIFAAGTMISMALLSTAFGLAMAGGMLGRNVQRVAPVLGVLGMGFGAWYALGAMGAVTYPL